jgi:hypothetical protein
MTQDDERKKFLLEFYQACWNNVTRAEESAWKMFAAYTAIFAGLAFASETIGIAGFLSLLSIFSFLAIALSLNANLWFVRNIGLISNLEKEFLDESDYGVLLPKSYKEKIPFFSFRVFEAWWVLIAAYFSISLTVLIFLFPQISDCNQKILVSAIYLVSLFLTILYGILLKLRHKRFAEGARGKQPESRDQRKG